MSAVRAAAYARRSNEQSAATEDKSVTRQVSNARAFAEKNGWAVADEHVYVDDGISGAEFERRPGLQAMLAAAARREFGVLVVSEQKSLGREIYATGALFKELALAGVEVWSYADAKCLTPRNHTDKLLTMVQGYADEDHRVRTAQRMHESHVHHVQRGHVVGGRVFGYRNKDVHTGRTDQHGRPLRDHVAHEVVPEEAAVVVRIFEMYADGLGLKMIARRLTAEGAVRPRYKAHDGLTVPRGWSPSTVRAVLTRPQYRGVIVWNRWRKRDDWGRVAGSPRPEADHVRVEAEHLRIVPEELWTRVQARQADLAGRAVRFDSGRLSGRPPKGEARNLLAGLATCGLCGGGLIVGSSGGPRRDAFGLDDLPSPGGEPRARGKQPAERGDYRFYVCARRRSNGSCANALRIPVGLVDEAVLRAVEEHALTPEAVEQVVRLTERDELAERRDALVTELTEVDSRIARLVAAVEAGGEASALVARASASWRTVARRSPTSWPRCVRSPGWRRAWWSRAWRSGGACCAAASRRAARCSSE